MTEDIKDWLGLLHAIPAEVWVIALGILIGVGLTHYIKRRWLPEQHRTPRVIEGINIGLTTVPIVRLWPHGYMQGFYVGLAVGLTVVLLYKPVMRWAYQKWPDLEEKVSAVRIKKMEDGELGIKVDDDKTRALTAAERKELGLPDNTIPKGDDK